ncbi:hypothetical protein [Nostoc sp. 106C]|nr:hypothetical protein [Nostoc sp. 106C]
MECDVSTVAPLVSRQQFLYIDRLRDRNKKHHWLIINQGASTATYFK